MFKEIRRKERKLDTAEAFEILEKGEYGILSTIGENGYPYGVPLNYVLNDNALYFHCAREGNKLENIQFNDLVSFCVVTYAKVQPEKFVSLYESAIVFGKTVEVIDEEKERAMVEFTRKFCKDNFREAIDQIHQFLQSVKVVKLTIDHVTAKTNL
ncbi:pyridoxamine 5'-phosphate oxidase family protein [Desulfosporosinus sp. Sb-LF]|uniref:pyridoxamine 5'-phosphate oxidase family protein n=1 Tax=Desulfosporosinus sp. Sb-LF TaxID=2560027 RepID=UPI00107F0BD5|nr:pyridoxamine 5'-phosphate oxidase family protein [Desulfosporosinus sp. Sb-LF]TGE34372.1 pyridoxamine 5'-phosphate oxidase family protein [Desulfosporosinus sp. Sb-LF]